MEARAPSLSPVKESPSRPPEAPPAPVADKPTFPIGEAIKTGARDTYRTAARANTPEDIARAKARVSNVMPTIFADAPPVVVPESISQWEASASTTFEDKKPASAGRKIRAIRLTEEAR
jgi:hypothetical protein